MNRWPLLIVLIATMPVACNDPATKTPATQQPAPASESAAMPADTDTRPAASDSIQADAAATAPVDGDATAAATQVASDDDAAVDQAIDSNLGDHDRYRAVIDAFQQAVRDGDKDGVAALVDYPIEVTIDGEGKTIGDAAAFVADYDRFMAPDIVAVIRTQRYADLFVSHRGVMFGSGEAWINGICRDDRCTAYDVRVVAVQPGPDQD